MKRTPYILGLLLVATAAWFGVVRADDSISQTNVTIDDPTAADEINSLNGQIASKKEDIDSLNKNIDSYKKKIEALQTQSQSLAVESEILDNRIAKAGLDIEATDAEIEAVSDEIALLQTRAAAVEKQLDTDRDGISEILRSMEVYDNDLNLQLLFGTDSFGEVFDRLHQLSSVNADLETALRRAQAEREQLIADRAAQVGKRERLSDLQTQQETLKTKLEEEKDAKESLLAQTERSEAQFKTFLASLRSEQQSINQEIHSLQGEVDRKLSGLDSGGAGSSVLSWPIQPLSGISTYFHDPTYPFRHLFEHPGIDIPTPVGTPVKSAAPGYVAWTKTGSMYGYYVMVIHADGVATLYAHLSKISVVQDQYVGRGDVIGLSGGQKGAPGAGLSTGPHLHFEVRSDGIPVDPMGYLSQ